MPIIHLIIKYKNSILFDKGTPIDENVTIKDFFTTFTINTLELEFWNVNFEAYLGKMKSLIIMIIKYKKKS